MATLNVMYQIAADISKLESGVQRGAASMEKLAGIAGTVGAAVTGAFSVGALVQFGRELIDTADGLKKMADITGISLQGLQKLQIVGDGAGNSIEELTNAVTQMQKRLAGGESSAVGAMKELGLNFEMMRDLAPDEQFMAIASRLKDVTDSADQTRLATDLFGRSGAMVLPSVKAGFDAVRDSAVGMSDDTIEALDTAGDTITAWWRSTKSVLAEAAVGLVMLPNNIGFAPAAERAAKAQEELEKLGASVDKFVKRQADLQVGPVGSRVFGIAMPNESQLAEMGMGLDQLGEKTLRLLQDRERAARIAAAAAKQEDDLRNAQMRQLESQIRLVESASELRFATLSVADAFQALPGASPIPTLSDLQTQVGLLSSQGIPDLKIRLQELGNQGFKQATKDAQGFSDFLERDLGKVIVGAFQGGGNVGKSIGGAVGNELGQTLTSGIGDALKGSLGKVLGGAVGSVIPGLVTALGGAVGGLFGKLFGNAEKAINPIRQAFVDAAGGLDALNQHARDAGVTLDHLLDAKNPKQYERAIGELNSAFSAHNLKVQDIDTSVGDLQRAVTAAGGAMPADLLETLHSLETMNGLTDSEREKLGLLADAATPSFAALQEKASKFGITLDALGPTFQKQDLGSKATEIVGLFDGLMGKGADAGGVLLGLSDEVSDLVGQAEKYGVALPKTLEPIVKHLFDTGHLTDDTGKKLETLAGLTFEDTPLDKGTSAIVDAIHELKATLEKLPSIAAAAASGVTGASSNIRAPKLDLGFDLGPQIVPMAAGGVGRAMGPTLFYSGGNEDFAFSGEGKRFGGGGGGGDIVIQIDGREIARAGNRYNNRDLLNRSKVRAN